MAKLPIEIAETIWNLKRQLLDIIHDATAAEYTLFEQFGETDRTMDYLEQLKSVAQQADERFAQFSILQRRLANAQPTATSDMLRLVTEVITYTQARLPAWERSIEEIKIEWRLS